MRFYELTKTTPFDILLYVIVIKGYMHCATDGICEFTQVEHSVTKADRLGRSPLFQAAVCPFRI